MAEAPRPGSLRAKRHQQQAYNQTQQYPHITFSPSSVSSPPILASAFPFAFRPQHCAEDAVRSSPAFPSSLCKDSNYSPTSSSPSLLFPSASRHFSTFPVGFTAIITTFAPGQPDLHVYSLITSINEENTHHSYRRDNGAVVGPLPRRQERALQLRTGHRFRPTHCRAAS